MIELIVNPELKSFQPDCKRRPPIEQLEIYITQRGAISPILAWNDTIVDGHRSYELYKKHQISFKVFHADFKSLEDAQLWVYENLMDDEQRKQRERPTPAERSINPVPESYWKARHVIHPNYRMIPLDRIRIDCNTQSRMKINPHVVREYVEAMKRGDHFPAIRVFQESPESDYILAEGFHRLAAHKETRPRLLILAEIEVGTVEDARWASFGANAGHGAKRSKEDLHNAIRGTLLHPNGYMLSDYRVAEHVRTSPSTVLRVRRELEATTSVKQSTERVGRDGRVMQTAKIGKVKAVTKKSSGKAKIADCFKPISSEQVSTNHPDLDLQNLIAFLPKESIVPTTKELFRLLHDRYGEAVTKSLAAELYEQYGR